MRDTTPMTPADISPLADAAGFTLMTTGTGGLIAIDFGVDAIYRFAELLLARERKRLFVAGMRTAINECETELRSAKGVAAKRSVNRVIDMLRDQARMATAT